MPRTKWDILLRHKNNHPVGPYYFPSLFAALFALHQHILDQQSESVRAKFQTMEEWHERSREALDTVSRIVIAIAGNLVTVSPANSGMQMIDNMPPMYPYIARVAIRHIRDRVKTGSGSWSASAREALERSINTYFERWDVSQGLRNTW
ncbi:hypothetical protein BT63DRAFT_461301 [Microthyrium microscopicum]|uniref:Uncharacterized protein n=1 Tax=Microthyrium microscopicum TaxID=703497 RepID=A0A6A6TY32_9PEZI|nr:hypothetical protein BT63DRAFT_461301 [Microthyrium microscopicum]